MNLIDRAEKLCSGFPLVGCQEAIHTVYERVLSLGIKMIVVGDFMSGKRTCRFQLIRRLATDDSPRSLRFN